MLSVEGGSSRLACDLQERMLCDVGGSDHFASLDLCYRRLVSFRQILIFLTYVRDYIAAHANYNQYPKRPHSIPHHLAGSLQP